MSSIIPPPTREQLCNRYFSNKHPPPVLDTESLAAQAAYTEVFARVRLGPEWSPGLRPPRACYCAATGSHIVNRGTPVAPLGQPQLNVPGKKEKEEGGPCSPDFPKNPITPQGRRRLTNG
jgi:hypothetical protein